ncbi:hypothetical protein D3C84_771050 [compost metagenome]
MAALSQVNHVVNHVRAAFLVSLDHKPNTVPTCQLRLKAQALQQIQRQFEPIGFFSIDVEANIVLLGEQRQRQQTGIKFIHDPTILRTAVTWMQCRKLDRNSGALINTTVA